MMLAILYLSSFKASEYFISKMAQSSGKCAALASTNCGSSVFNSFLLSAKILIALLFS